MPVLAFPMASESAALPELETTLAAAVQILVHRLRPRFSLEIQCQAPLDRTREDYVRAAEAEPEPSHQARDGALWGARRLRDDLLVNVVFAQFQRGTTRLSYRELRQKLDAQLGWTSQLNLGFALSADDEGLLKPFENYLIPLTPEGPPPFWLGATWGMQRWHGLARLALQAREHGADILEEWVRQQTR